MKRIILSAAVAMMALAAQAQNLAVAYDVVATSVKAGASPATDSYTLITDGSRSMFYNPDKWTTDSLMSTPEGKAALQQQAMAQIASGKPLKAMAKGYYICKEADGTVTSYHDEAIIGKLRYTEPLGGIAWVLADSVATIAGYECQMAEADWHGRHWTAWFAPDIPVQEGPWKLCGLPGLILAAEADGGAYSFTDTAFGTTTETIPAVINPDGYDRTDRLSFLKEKREATDHAMERLRARFHVVKVTNPDGTPVTKLNVDRSEADFIETDY